MRLLRSSVALVACAFSAAWLACGDDGGPGTPQVTALVIDAGNAQVGAAGQALATPLSVIAFDAANNPVPGVTVTWSAATGGGSVNPGSSTTNASGVAATTRTLGPNAGSQTTTATTAGPLTVTFNSTAQVQGATHMAVSDGDNQTDTVLSTLAAPLAVVVRNQTLAGVPGVVVNWAAQGGGSVSAATSTTDANGIATVTRILGGTAGPQTATATVTGLTGSPVTFTLTATAGNAAVLAKTGGDNGTAAPGGQVTYTVTARDAHGNPKSGVTVDWAVASGGGSIAPPSNTTGVNGTASATRTLSGNLGEHTATATATGLTGSPATFTTTAASITNVVVANNSFTPAAVTIPLNGTVNWQWQGTTSPHNVTFSTSGAPTNILDRTSQSEGRQFTSPGTFNYSCTNHPGMNGSVTVNP